MRFAAFVLPAALAASLLAGCAGSTTNNSADDFQGDQKAVAQVIDDFGNAGKNHKASEICSSIFAKATADKLTRGTDTCEDVVKDQLKDASDFDLTIKQNGITIDGAKATAIVKSKFCDEDVDRTLRLVKEGTAWRLATIDKAPDPPSCKT